MNELDVVERVLLITVLAGLIGFERERHGRAAGFRTHILVGLGACLVMMTGLHLMETLAGRAPFDPTRMAAQIVSGIGFLGAGTILRFRASVRGLTTAASLWAIAGVGIAVGAGFFLGAILVSGIVIFTLFVLSGIERGMRRVWYRTLRVESRAAAGDLERIRAVLSNYDMEIRDFEVRKGGREDTWHLEFAVKILSEEHLDDLLQELSRIEGTRGATWV